MSRSAKVVVFYGIVYQRDTASHARFLEPKSRPEEDERNLSDDHPYVIQMFGQPVNGIQIVSLGYSDLPRFALAAAATVERGDDWQPLKLSGASATISNSLWDDVLKAYCKKYKLRYQTPQWFVVPLYS